MLASQIGDPLQKAPAAVLEHRFVALGGQLFGLGGSDLVEALVEPGHDVEAIENVQGLRGLLGDHLQVRLPQCARRSCVRDEGRSLVAG